MTARLVDIRDEVYNRILVKRAGAEFVFNDFDVEKTWFPYERLEALATDHPAGKVYVIGLAPTDAVVKSRTNLSQRESPIMLGYQRAEVNPQDQTLIDDLVELVEQLDNLCIKDVDAELFSFSRLEYLKDENEVPFSFMGLRNANVFEAYFTVYYTNVLP